MNINIDVDKLNAAVASAYPKHMEELAPKAASVAGFAGISGIGEAVTTFCAAWPKVRPFLNTALKGFAWFFPEKVALAKAVLGAIDTEIVPAICGTQKP